MGVVSGCCLGGIIIDVLIIMITFPYFACISSFFGSSILLLCSIIII